MKLYSLCVLASGCISYVSSADTDPTAAMKETIVQQSFLNAVQQGNYKAVNKMKIVPLVAPVYHEAVLTAVRANNMEMIECLQSRANFATNNYEAARMASEERLVPFFISILLSDHLGHGPEMSLNDSIKFSVEKGLVQVFFHLAKFYVPPYLEIQKGDIYDERLGLVSTSNMQVPSAGSLFLEFVSLARKSPQREILLPAILQKNSNLIQGVTHVLLMLNFEDLVRECHFNCSRGLRDTLVTMAHEAEELIPGDITFEYPKLAQILRAKSQNPASLTEGLWNTIFI